jgi:hypothetical protein
MMHTLDIEGPLLPCRTQALVHALMQQQEEFGVQVCAGRNVNVAVGVHAVSCTRVYACARAKGSG